MGVINNLGLVGIIDNTSPRYSTVISILNVKSRINAKIKKSNHFGSLIWNGKSTGFVQLIDVPRLASVRKGDYCDRYAIRNFPRKHKHWNY
jgi:rod shape-determining protein MreC